MKPAPSFSSALRAAAAIALLFAASMFAPAVLAQHGHDRGHGPGHAHRGPGHEWHGNTGRFHEYGGHGWRGGHWAHGHHGGRLGWWWVAGPSWYYYPAPVYPYPPGPWVPAEAFSPAPRLVAPPPVQYWYYCEALRNYYPYVSACPSGWEAVPSTPDATAPAPILQVP